MTEKNAWVRVVVVNHNAGPLLQDCVDALAEQTMPAFEVVIVDNASTVQPIAGLRLPDTRFRVLHAGSNLGFAAGSNLGARGARAAWIVTLNPDTRPRPDLLAELRAATERYPWAALFGSTQLAMQQPDVVDGFGDVLSAFGTAWRSGNSRPADDLPQADCEVFSPCAAAALYSRACFERLGGFDETFFCYLEDVDFGFRARLVGERCVQARRAEILHEASAIAGHLSAFSVFHSYRNRIWLFAKNAPWPLLLPIIGLQSTAMLVAVARPSARSYRRAALKGVWAGLKGLRQALRSRRAIQQERSVSAWDIARMMVWNPLRARPRGQIQVLRRLDSVSADAHP
jgi:GT2 family glycosyltransferase